MFNNLNTEFHSYDKKYQRHYLYDFVDIDNKKVIEFNGNYWHCDPNKYASDYYHKQIKKVASEVWEYDKQKREHIENRGYIMKVIWELDYKQDPQQVIKECLEFLANG